MLDDNAQPAPGVNAQRRVTRDLAEMLGLVKGVLADGEVSDAEVRALRDWAEAHPDVTSAWPGRILLRRLRRILQDGHVSETERADLHELLERLTGGGVGVLTGLTAASALPLDQPPPLLEIPDRVFVLTGRFAFGPRSACEEATRRIGGWPERDVTQRTDVVVIGTFGSRDWSQSSWGRKIEKAIRYREEYGRPVIVFEDHWAEQL